MWFSTQSTDHVRLFYLLFSKAIYGLSGPCAAPLRIIWWTRSTFRGWLVNGVVLRFPAALWATAVRQHLCSKQPWALHHGHCWSCSRLHQLNLQQTEMLWRLILIRQFRPCHKRNDMFQTRESFTLFGAEVTSYNHVDLLGKPAVELFTRSMHFGAWQHKPQMELPNSVGLDTTEIHLCF